MLQYCNQMRPGQKDPGHMSPEQMGPRQMSPRTNGSRTNESQDKWVPDKWVPDKWVPGQMRSRKLPICLRHTKSKQTNTQQILIKNTTNGRGNCE